LTYSRKSFILIQIRQSATRTYSSKEKSWPGETAKSVAATRDVRTAQVKAFFGHLQQGNARSVPAVESARSVVAAARVKPNIHITLRQL